MKRFLCIILAFYIILLVVGLLGCENTTNVSNNNTYFAFESLNSLLGKEKDVVLSTL